MVRKKIWLIFDAIKNLIPYLLLRPNNPRYPMAAAYTLAHPRNLKPIRARISFWRNAAKARQDLSCETN